MCRGDQPLDERNRLKINKDKTQFVWLGNPHQLSRIRCQKITFAGADIQISTEAMCLGVLLDSRLTFAPHIRHISSRCFYHLRQLRVVQKSLTVGHYLRFLTANSQSNF